MHLPVPVSLLTDAAPISNVMTSTPAGAVPTHSDAGDAVVVALLLMTVAAVNLFVTLRASTSREILLDLSFQEALEVEEDEEDEVSRSLSSRVQQSTSVVTGSVYPTRIPARTRESEAPIDDD